MASPLKTSLVSLVPLAPNYGACVVARVHPRIAICSLRDVAPPCQAASSGCSAERELRPIHRLDPATCVSPVSTLIVASAG
jgi:hypothetical protein